MVVELRRISKKIPKEVLEYANQHSEGRTKFAGYLQQYNDELILRTFAFKEPANKALLVTECLRESTGYPNIRLAKNIYFTNLAGYNAVFDEKESEKKHYSQFDKWYKIDSEFLHMFKVAYNIINIEILKESKYKYCGYSGQEYLMDYLEKYNKHPCIEFISKLGINPSILLIKKAEKDKLFRKFLFKIKNEIKFYHSPQMIINAYNNGIGLQEAYDIHFINTQIPEIKNTNIDRIKLKKYLDKKNIAFTIYNDYLKAIKYLRLDLKDTKNVYPNNFIEMHDLRISEYDSEKVKENLKKKKQFCKKFEQVSKQFSNLNYSGQYVVLVAPSVKSLILEGNALHHCVGKMGYDQKMVNKESLILFVREKQQPEKPYLTMEFSLKNKNILQIHGDNNSPPQSGVKKFIEYTWLNFAKKQLKKVC